MSPPCISTGVLNDSRLPKINQIVQPSNYINGNIVENCYHCLLGTVGLISCYNFFKLNRRNKYQMVAGKMHGVPEKRIHIKQVILNWSSSQCPSVFSSQSTDWYRRHGLVVLNGMCLVKDDPFKYYSQQVWCICGPFFRILWKGELMLEALQWRG